MTDDDRLRAVAAVALDVPLTRDRCALHVSHRRRESPRLTQSRREVGGPSEHFVALAHRRECSPRLTQSLVQARQEQVRVHRRVVRHGRREHQGIEVFHAMQRIRAPRRDGESGAEELAADAP